jgi:hypothetical protein
MEEKPSPLGEDFSSVFFAARVPGFGSNKEKVFP